MRTQIDKNDMLEKIQYVGYIDPKVYAYITTVGNKNFILKRIGVSKEVTFSSSVYCVDKMQLTARKFIQIHKLGTLFSAN